MKTDENPVGANGILWESDGENEYVNAASGGENEYVNAVSGGENEYINAVSGGENEYTNANANEYTNEPHNNVVSNTSFVPSGNLANKQTWKFYAPCNIYAFVYSHYNKDPCLYRHPVVRMTLSVAIVIVLFEN